MAIGSGAGSGFLQDTEHVVAGAGPAGGAAFDEKAAEARDAQSADGMTDEVAEVLGDLGRFAIGGGAMVADAAVGDAAEV